MLEFSENKIIEIHSRYEKSRTNQQFCLQFENKRLCGPMTKNGTEVSNKNGIKI